MTSTVRYGVSFPPEPDSFDNFAYRQFFEDIVRWIRSRHLVRTVTTDTLADSETFHFRCATNSGNIIITLPSAAGNVGRMILVTNIESGGNKVTVAARGTDTIEGSTSIDLNTQWSKALLISNNVDGWERII